MSDTHASASPTHQECLLLLDQLNSTPLDGAGCGLFLKPTIGLSTNPALSPIHHTQQNLENTDLMRQWLQHRSSWVSLAAPRRGAGCANWFLSGLLRCCGLRKSIRDSAGRLCHPEGVVGEEVLGQEIIEGAKNKRSQFCPTNASMLTFSLDTDCNT